jgi:hypothetical protein
MAANKAKSHQKIDMQFSQRRLPRIPVPMSPQKQKQLSSYPLFLATVNSSNHHHYCLSLA